MHYRLSRLAIVVALACSVGLQWGFLQSVAWLGMVVRYAQDETVIKALARTFDGKHPCALCKAIAKGKQAEKKAEFPDARKKFEFSYSADHVQLVDRDLLVAVDALDEMRHSRFPRAPWAASWNCAENL